MFKRRTTHSRQRSRMRKLEVRVMSPRIAWFGFLRLCGRSAKFFLILALAVAAGWGGWLGIKRAFLENPEFQLRMIALNPNPALDEADLVKAASIDLHANLFDLDVKAIRQRLASRPEIAAVTVERRLPSTLDVHVTARVPRAWIGSVGAETGSLRKEGGLLVDAAGTVFPCPALQWQEARDLPIILLPRDADAQGPVAGEVVKTPQLQRCFRLLDSALAADADASRWIDYVQQLNTWSVQLVTRNGTTATFGLDNHSRQMADFAAALDHASRQGYAIATINLIPQRNIPITLRSEPAPPRATPVPEPTKEEIRSDRRSNDLKSLLNRN